jgi:hypothetical protein
MVADLSAGRLVEEQVELLRGRAGEFAPAKDRVRALGTERVRVGPGDGRVVAGAGFQAAMQDTDEPIAELTQGCLVADVSGPKRVVIGARAWRSFQ